MSAKFPDFSAHPVLLAILAIANWPVYRELAKLFFRDAEGFAEAVEYWLMSEIYSPIKNY